MREFETGATRNDDEDRLDFEGFEHPLVVVRFAEYMHGHRRQKDGILRAADNWQKGIPLDCYMKSLSRHFMDVWLHHRGCPHKAKGGIEDALCAMRFNVNGYLFEILKKQQEEGK